MQNDIDVLFPHMDEPGIIQPFMHRGEWAVHEALPMLISHLGPSDVRIATYMVSEESLRALLLAQGVHSMRLLLDLTVKRHKLPLLLFAQNVTADIRLDYCHAKVLLVENGERRFGIVGSANLNRAHRWESGFWFTAGPHYDYFLNQYDSAYANALPSGFDEP